MTSKIMLNLAKVLVPIMTDIWTCQNACAVTAKKKKV